MDLSLQQRPNLMSTAFRQRFSLAILTYNTTTVACLNQMGTCHSNSGGQISRRHFHCKVISTSRPRNLGRVHSENLSSKVLTIHALDVSHMTLTDKLNFTHRQLVKTFRPDKQFGRLEFCNFDIDRPTNQRTLFHEGEHVTAKAVKLVALIPGRIRI